MICARCDRPMRAAESEAYDIPARDGARDLDPRPPGAVRATERYPSTPPARPCGRRWGPSPRLRGAALGRPLEQQAEGAIPACAGSSRA